MAQTDQLMNLDGIADQRNIDASIKQRHTAPKAFVDINLKLNPGRCGVFFPKPARSSRENTKGKNMEQERGLPKAKCENTTPTKRDQRRRQHS